MAEASRPRAVALLADWLAGLRYDDIPAPVVARAGDCLLDAVGAALAGRGAAASRAMADVMGAQMPTGAARLWFSDRPALSPVGAATANAMAATALDIDDGHRRAAGHPGAAVIAAAVAVAEAVGATRNDLIVAVVAGYEASVAVALARRSENHPSTVSGRWSGVGAAVAAARLMGLPPVQVEQAILIAEAHAPRVSAALPHGFAGSDVKEGIAWSVQSGLFAVELARAGFTGYPDTFEQGGHYDPARLTGGIGAYGALDGLFFKPYACCRWIHSAIDALAGIMADEGLGAGSIDAIEVETFVRAAQLGNHVAPQTEAEAQFSIPFCLAVTAVAGQGALTPLDATLIGDARIEAMATRVQVSVAADMQAAFPALAPARVRVCAGRRTYARRVEAAFGDPTNPMHRSDLQAKFRTLAAPHLDTVRMEAILRLCALEGPGDARAPALLDPIAAPV